MKILLTTDLFKPSINGVVTSVLNLYYELKKQGHDVRILTLSKKVNLSYKDDDFYYIKSIPFNVYPDVRASLIIKDKMMDELVYWKPDVIHTQCEFFSYNFAKIISWRTKAPIVHTYHTMYEDYSEYLVKNKTLSKYMVLWLSKNRIADAEIIIAPTEKVKNKLMEYEVTNDIKVVPTGIDLSKFDFEMSDEEKIELKKKYSIPLDSKLLLFIGRIGKEKNIEELLSCFKELTKIRKDVYLIIVGGGPYLNKIKAEIENLELGKNVGTLGMVNPSETPYIYKMSDIFVSASQSETQGLTYIEAMANSLPEVCKYDDCLENVLIDGKNGYFFTDSKSFAKNINKILNDDNLYSEMCREAYETSKIYSKENFAKSVFDIYKLAISKHQSRPNRLVLMKVKVNKLFDDINMLK